VFELLVSGDAVVADHDYAIAQCQAEWRLPAVHRNWTSAPSGAGAKWSFARLQRDRRLAPTALEILGIPYDPVAPDQRPFGYAYLPEIAAAQGDRPVRNHSTVVSTGNLDATVARLEATGGHFRLDPPKADMPFPRLWVGFSVDDPGVYDPGTDGGLRIEILPHAALAMPDPDVAARPVPLDAGAPVRIVARTMLVEDLDPVLAAVETHLGWRPTTDREGSDRARRARFEFSYPDSAVLEVVQPQPASEEGKFLASWGPGPFSIRIAVNDVHALQRHLVAEGVPLEELPPIGHGEKHRLFRPPVSALGTAFEFVDNV
jgi:hypothetical protein